MSSAMSIEQRERFLAGVHIGIVSIPRANKGPLTVPIWYDYEPGKKLWMITQSDSIKGKLLQKTTRISLCVQLETAPYQYVSVEGPFVINAPNEGQLLSMAIRYLGEEQGRSYVASSGTSEGNVIVSLSPETWYTVDYNNEGTSD